MLQLDHLTEFFSLLYVRWDSSGVEYAGAGCGGHQRAEAGKKRTVLDNGDGGKGSASGALLN
jgi:hypothetical protein